MTPSIAAAFDQPLIERTTLLQRQLLNPWDTLHQFAADGDIAMTTIWLEYWGNNQYK